VSQGLQINNSTEGGGEFTAPVLPSQVVNSECGERGEYIMEEKKRGWGAGEGYEGREGLWGSGPWGAIVLHQQHHKVTIRMLYL